MGDLWQPSGEEGAVSGWNLPRGRNGAPGPSPVGASWFRLGYTVIKSPHG